MARMVRWRKLSGQNVWRARDSSWNNRKPNTDLVFVIHAGVRSSFLIKNPRLEVLVKHEGERYAKHVVASTEFTATWLAKDTIDSLLQVISVMHLSNDESRQWLIDTLSKINTKPAEKVSIYPGKSMYEYIF
jgi:hypothetical protein